MNRAVTRLFLWGRIWRELRPIHPGGRLGLLASAMIDSLRFVVAPGTCLSPQTCCSLLLEAPRLRCRFRVRGGTDDIYSVLPFREMDVHEAILGNLREGDVFVDGGAHVGYYSVLGAKAVGAHGKVISIEAVPPSAKQLKENLQLNGIAHARVVEKAVQDDDGGPVRDFRVMGGQFSMASCVWHGGDGACRHFSVEATRIDDICVDDGPIRLMKLDVEGSELAALKGATRTLEKTDLVVVEGNQSGPEISRLLSEAGFGIRKLRFTTYLLGSRFEKAGS